MITRFKLGHTNFFYNKYDHRQKLLEPDHEYKWLSSEYKCDPITEKEDIYITQEQKRNISKMNPVEIFKLFFLKI